MPKVANRAKQTSATQGTGAYDLDSSAEQGWQDFIDAKGISDGDQVWYVAWDGADNWEVGRGTLNVGAGTGGKDQLTRDAIGESTEVGDAAVPWGAGTRDIWIATPAGEFLVGANNLSDVNDAPTARTNLDVGGLGEGSTWTGNNTYSGRTTLSGTAVAPVGVDKWATA